MKIRRSGGVASAAVCIFAAVEIQRYTPETPPPNTTQHNTTITQCTHPLAPLLWLTSCLAHLFPLLCCFAGRWLLAVSGRHPELLRRPPAGKPHPAAAAGRRIRVGARGSDEPGVYRVPQLPREICDSSTTVVVAGLTFVWLVRCSLCRLFSTQKHSDALSNEQGCVAAFCPLPPPAPPPSLVLVPLRSCPRHEELQELR